MNSILALRDAVMFTQYEGGERAMKEKFLPDINRLAASAMSADDFHVRGAYICNTARDYYYSRFSVDALNEVADMIRGRPVLIGHQHDSVPVGRFFNASVVYEQRGREPRRDNNWVKAHFYIPADDEGNRLVRRIDAGIYKEVSLGWRCAGADCSICGNPINDRNACQHVPGEVYDEGFCEYVFNGITSVLEGSLVYAGGQKDTSTFNPERADFREPGERLLRSMSIDEFLGQRQIDYRTIPGAKGFSLQAEEYAVSRKRQLRTSIAAVECHKERFDDRASAARWTRGHDFRADKFTETVDAYRFTQFNPKGDEPRREVKLDDSVRAVVIDQKPVQRSEESATRSLEALFTGGE